MVGQQGTGAANRIGRQGWELSEDFSKETASAVGKVLPSTGAIVEAGAFGAAMGGVSAGIADGAAVRSGEMDSRTALRNVAKSGVQGAVTMSVATTVAHMVRANPLLGVGMVAVLGLGALALMGRKRSKGVAPAPTAAKGT